MATTANRSRNAQVAHAKKAAALKTANAAKNARAPAATPSLISDENAKAFAVPPYRERDSIRLIYKPELLALVGVSYGSIFSWMRRGKFPLAREIGPGGRTCRIAWVESEIQDWLAARPPRRMKAPANSVIE